MHFYKLDHEATWDDIKNFNYPNQKLGVIAHIQNKGGYYYSKEDPNPVMTMAYMKILVGVLRKMTPILKMRLLGK